LVSDPLNLMVTNVLRYCDGPVRVGDGWVRCSSSAARVKLKWRAATANMRSVSSEGKRAMAASR